MRSRPFSLVSGLVLMLVGTVVLAGWLRHDPVLVRLLPASEAMSSSSAAGWLLAGLGLLAATVLPAHRDRRFALPAALAGAALVLLGAGALAEWLGGPSLGFVQDPAATALWLNDPYPYPGRMRPLSAFGFMALGLGTALLARGEVAPRVLRFTGILALLVLGVGALGLAGSFTSAASLYLGPVFATALGFIVGGIGLVALHRSRAGGQSIWGMDDSQRITLLAGVIVVVTGTVGIAGGFGVLYPQIIKELEANLAVSLKSRSSALEEAIAQAWEESQDFANQPLRLEAIERIADGRRDGADLLVLQKVTAQAPAFGFSAVRFFDATGREVAHAGEFIRDPDLAVPINLPSSSLLMWKGGYVFHTAIDMFLNGRKVGRIEAERRLLLIEDLAATDGLGVSADFPVCARDGAGLDCFPFRSAGNQVVRHAPLQFNGRPVPLAYALKGGTGIVRTTDYRGVQVIAAYGPVGDLGLVADLKIDAAEFYKPVARRLWPLFLLLLALAAGSILLLRLQVVPLVRNMRREIEDRKRAEERLQQSEAKLAEITATLGEGVYVLDARGAITFVNREAERLLGWSAQELLGKDAHQVFHARRPDGTAVAEEDCPVHQTFLRCQTYRSNDEWFMRKDGSFLPVAIISSPIMRNGTAEGSVASFLDITESKRIARELARHRDDLEQLVEERTGELRKLNRELEAFSYSVSHDLRAPLRAINGYGGALREDYGAVLPAEAHDYLDRMHAATVRMGELVDGLLNLSQVIRCEADRVDVDLTQLAATIAASLHEAEPRRNVSFSIEPGVAAVGDPALLRVLLENLFVNAWKFTANRAEGRIAFGSEARAGERVFYLRDNGVGFDMQFAHKLFQPFERLHKHGEFAGNGIGLATVRRIVERHSGRVWAESGLDEGTTIFFVLGDAA